MKFEELNLLAQLVESMKLSAVKLEEALNENNADKINNIKAEMLKFQKQVEEILKSH